MSSLWGSSECQFILAKASITCSGGLVLMWNPSSFRVDQTICGSRWLIIIRYLTKCSWDCALCLIYSEYTLAEQSRIYNEISLARQSFSCHFMLAGDFNQIFRNSGRRGQHHDNSGMRVFRDWVNDNNLVDLPLIGRNFTCIEGILGVNLIASCIIHLGSLSFLL